MWLVDVGCGWLWLVGVGWCWLGLVGFGWCWMVLDGVGWLVGGFREREREKAGSTVVELTDTFYGGLRLDETCQQLLPSEQCISPQNGETSLGLFPHVSSWFLPNALPCPAHLLSVCSHQARDCSVSTIPFARLFDSNASRSGRAIGPINAMERRASGRTCSSDPIRSTDSRRRKTGLSG